MMKYLSRENKADAAGAVLAVGGIALVAVASELALPFLAAIGTALVAGTAVARVIDFKRHQSKTLVPPPQVMVEKKELTHSGSSR